MSLRNPPFSAGAEAEVSALIATLHETGQRLEELTAGEVDTVADREGRTFLLRSAQEQLRHIDAARQAAILNALPANIALLDAQGVIVSVNEAWRRFGVANVLHSPGHAVGVNYLEICDRARGIDAFEASRAAEGIRAALAGELKSFSLEYPCHSPTEQRWFLMMVSPLTDDHPNGAVVMHVNITERKRIEETLRESEERFFGAFDQAPIGVALVWPDGRWLKVNRALCDLVGYSEAELLTRTFQDITYPADLAADLENVRRLLNGEIRTYQMEKRYVHARGQLVTVLINVSLVRDPRGQPLYFISQIQDITQRKEAEHRIAYLSRVHAVLSGINTLIVRVRDRTVLFNEACRIAVEAGGFRMSLIGMVDRSAKTIVPVASAGKDEELLAAIKHLTSTREMASITMVARAINEKKSIVSNDSRSDPQVLLGSQYAEAGVRSIAILPLIVSGEAIGAMALYAGESEFFHAEEMALLTELAGDIAFAIDHIGKEEKLVRLSRVKAVTSGINSLIVHVRNRRELFDEACRIAVEHGGFGIAWIGKFDPVTQDITPTAWAGIDTRLSGARRSARADIPEGQGLAGRAVREKTAVLDNDITKHPETGGRGRKEAIGRGYGSLIALPLLTDGAVLGTLSLFAKEVDFFDAEEIKLLTELAGNISFASDMIGKEEKLAKLSRIRAVSGEINAVIVRVLEREALLKEVCRIAVEVGKFDLVWIGALDQKAKVARPFASAGFPPEVVHPAEWNALTGPGTTLEESMRTGKIAVCNDILVDAAVGVLRIEALRQGCRSAVCLPLLVDDNVEAGILLYARGVNFFDRDELALLNEVASDISLALQSITQRERLDYLALYDTLTGLANRTLFLERVAQYMRVAVSGGHKLAVGLIDLERFRNINESLGRPAGDALLRQLAEWLTSNVGDVNLLSRMGTDQFAVLLPELDPAGNVARLVEKTIDALLKHPFRLNDEVFRVAVKMGVALFPDDGSDADTLLRNAEAALKKAKARGDRYLFYAQKMNEAAAGKLTLENQLREALDKGEFVLHYQPKVSLASGLITSAEALIRWNDPRTGLVPPGRFIPALEETGLIYEVGRWALRQAITDYLRWRAAGLPAVRIAVNVSPLQLRNHGFVAEIEQVIGIDRLAAEGLELEITESVIMDDVRRNIASLQTIRDMGVTIAIDDFGTGFSSLSYLAKLPVDTLKIDRSFVIDMTSSPDGLALVSTIINLAHALKRKVVAEGVETEEQSRLLRLLNCDEMQGYLFSKPVPAEIFEQKFLAVPVSRAGAASF